MTVQFDVLDELSGVQAAWLTFRSPTIPTASPPSIQRTATFHQYLTAPRIMAGTVTGSVTFPRFDRGGDWTVTQVCVIDEVKHVKCYTGAALAILGPTEITVISNRLTLTPEVDENPVGTQHTVTATLSNQDGPLSGRTILFSVLEPTPRLKPARPAAVRRRSPTPGRTSVATRSPPATTGTPMAPAKSQS